MALTQLPKSGTQTGFDPRAYVDGLANKFIVKPKTVTGIGGFVFDYEGETNVSIQADITDHYLETNEPVQDHIAIHPIKMTLRGYVAELVQLKPTGLLGALEQIQNRLTTVPAYLGKYTPGAISTIQKAISKTQNTVNTIDQSLARIKNIVGLFSKSVQGRTNQERAYNKLQSLMVTRQLMFVETPYGTFNNMAIESLVLVQDDTTKMWSDITVTMKRMNFVDIQTSTLDFRSGRNGPQSQGTVNQGATSGTPVDSSVLFKGLNALKGAS